MLSQGATPPVFPETQSHGCLKSTDGVAGKHLEKAGEGSCGFAPGLAKPAWPQTDASGPPAPGPGPNPAGLPRRPLCWAGQTLPGRTQPRGGSTASPPRPRPRTGAWECEAEGAPLCHPLTARRGPGGHARLSLEGARALGEGRGGEGVCGSGGEGAESDLCFPQPEARASAEGSTAGGRPQRESQAPGGKREESLLPEPGPRAAPGATSRRPRGLRGSPRGAARPLPEELRPRSGPPAEARALSLPGPAGLHQVSEEAWALESPRETSPAEVAGSPPALASREKRFFGGFPAALCPGPWPGQEREGGWGREPCEGASNPYEG